MNPYVNPKAAKISSDFKPYFNVDLNRGYSMCQGEAQSVSEALYRQTTVGKLYIDALTRYVIGKGLTPMSAPETELLGWDHDRIEQFTRQAEAYWRLMTETVNIDYYGKDTFLQLQQIIFKDITGYYRLIKK